MRVLSFWLFPAATSAFVVPRYQLMQKAQKAISTICIRNEPPLLSKKSNLGAFQPGAPIDGFIRASEITFGSVVPKSQKPMMYNDLQSWGGDDELEKSFSDTVSDDSLHQGPPLELRAQISKTDAGTLVIDMPAQGFTVKSAMSGAFSVAWLSAIGPASLSGGIAAAPFLLPFWLAGGLIMKNTFVEAFVNTQLSIGEFGWSLKSTFRNSKIRKESFGSTDQLKEANVVNHTKIIEGKPRYSYELRLYTQNNAVGVLNSSNATELEFLAFVINQHVEKLRLERDSDKALSKH